MRLPWPLAVAAILVAPLGCAARVALLPFPQFPASKVEGYFDYKGFTHSHTDFSEDAYGSYKDIARQASEQSVDFVISTDHNTLDAVKQAKEGWYGKTLMLSGVESTRPEGYLLGLGLTRYAVNKADPTESFLSSVEQQGGIALIAHPGNRKWAWRGPIDARMAGMEILDLADLFFASSLFSKLKMIALYPFLRSRAYLELDSGPADTLREWDGITGARRFVGTYGPDFHQAIQIRGVGKVRWPPAGEIMRVARDHILSKTAFAGELDADRGTVLDAIRQGHLYVSLDILGDATGFLFSAAQDGAQAWMGDELAVNGATRFTVALPAGCDPLKPVIHVIRDGAEIARQPWAGAPYSFSDARAGVYRIEVSTEIPRFFGGTREIDWIYSNPIYVRAR